MSQSQEEAVPYFSLEVSLDQSLSEGDEHPWGVSPYCWALLELSHAQMSLALCLLQLHLCLISEEIPLPAKMSVDAAGSSEARIPEVHSKRGNSLSLFTYTFPRCHSGPGMSPGIQAGFPVFFIFSLSICIFYPSTLIIFLLEICSNYVH